MDESTSKIIGAIIMLIVLFGVVFLMATRETNRSDTYKRTYDIYSDDGDILVTSFERYLLSHGVNVIETTPVMRLAEIDVTFIDCELGLICFRGESGYGDIFTCLPLKDVNITNPC